MYGRSIVEALLKGNKAEAKELFREAIENELSLYLEEYLAEVKNVQKMGRTKLVRVRVRAGKVQRRKKFANAKGFTIRGGKVVRMSPAERLHRKRGARKAKVKIRSKRSTINRKRKRSLMKRRSLGLK